MEKRDCAKLGHYADYAGGQDWGGHYPSYCKACGARGAVKTIVNGDPNRPLFCTGWALSDCDCNAILTRGARHRAGDHSVSLPNSECQQGAIK